MSITETPVTTPLVLGATPQERFTTLYPLTGMFVSLRSGDTIVEGVLVNVLRPSSTSATGPLVAIDTGMKMVAGPVLAGDVLCLP